MRTRVLQRAAHLYRLVGMFTGSAPGPAHGGANPHVEGSTAPPTETVTGSGDQPVDGDV